MSYPTCVYTNNSETLKYLIERHYCLVQRPFSSLFFIKNIEIHKRISPIGSYNMGNKSMSWTPEPIEYCGCSRGSIFYQIE